MKLNNDIRALISSLLILIFSIILFLSLSGCKLNEYHLRKANKHIALAKANGAIIKPDTAWQYSYTKETIFDTLTNTYKEVLRKDSTIYIVTNNISVGMSKQDRKALDDYYKHLEKMVKLNNDSLQKALNAAIKIVESNNKAKKVETRNENKSPWAITIGLLAVLGILLVIVIILRKFRII